MEFKKEEEMINIPYYFSHDSNALHDPKIKAMIRDYGMAGYGIWWALIELMSQQTNYKLEKFPKLFEGLAEELSLNSNQSNASSKQSNGSSTLKQEYFTSDTINPEHIEIFISDCINDYWLLKEDDNFIWSNSLLRRMEIKENKRLARVEAGRLGGIKSGESRRQTKQNEATLEANEPKKRKEKKVNERKEKNIYSQERKKVIDYLNKKLNTDYNFDSNVNRKFLNARFNENYHIEDCLKVIDIKYDEWIGTDQEKYLRPETLFGNKFESYLNQKISNGAKHATNRHHVNK